MNQYIEIIIQNDHPQEEKVEEEDNLQVQDQEVKLENSIVQLVINALAISSRYNLQAWEEEDLSLSLFLFLAVAEVAELQVVGLDGQEDCYIVAEISVSIIVKMNIQKPEHLQGPNDHYHQHYHYHDSDHDHVQLPEQAKSEAVELDVEEGVGIAELVKVVEQKGHLDQAKVKLVGQGCL